MPPRLIGNTGEYGQFVQLRAQAQLALGARFSRKKFNDFVLSQGLLSPALLKKAVETEFIAP